MNKDFYDDRELRDIDSQINDAMNKPTLVDGMKERSKRMRAGTGGFSMEIKKYWYIYLPLLVSAMFTSMLAIYMGLAPYLTQNANGGKDLTLNTDIGHLLTAFIYLCAFLYITEISFGIFHNLFHKREEDNDSQYYSTLAGMVLSGISIIGTGISGGVVVASVLGTLSEFRTIPESAQKWVVAVIPVMLGVYAILLAIYKLSSRMAVAERMAHENRQKMELDNRMRMDAIKTIGERQIQAAAIKLYADLVMRGILSQKEADWALNSGLSLLEIEKRLGRDLTGEGVVGGGSMPVRRPTPVRPTPSPISFPVEEGYDGMENVPEKGNGKVHF